MHNEERALDYFKKFNREKVLKLLVDSNSPTILDVGANNGSSLIEFKKWWPSSKVHCFEPQYECWNELDDLSNEFTDISINKFALGNENDESKEFYSHDLNTGISGFNKINIESKDSIDLSNLFDTSRENYKKTINHKRNVQVKRLDEYINNNNMNQIDLLKIDTQGYELEVLEGLGAELNKVKVLITELMFYDYYEKSLSFYELESILRPFKFSLYDISHVTKNPMNGRTDWIDVIYVQNTSREDNALNE